MALEFGSPNMPAMIDGRNGTMLSSIYFDPLHKRLDQRLNELETIRINWLEAVDVVLRQGLKRIDVVLAPTIEKINLVLELGFLIAPSQTEAALNEGDVLTFVVDEGPQRDLFRPTAFVTVTRTSTPQDYAIARKISYSQATGALVCEIVTVEGDRNPHAGWEIGAVAGSTLAQMVMLTQAITMRDATAADRVAIAADRLTATQAVAAINAKFTVSPNPPDPSAGADGDVWFKI